MCEHGLPKDECSMCQADMVLANVAQMANCEHGCVICGLSRPATVIVHIINGLAYHHDCAEDRSDSDVCPVCAEDADV